MEERGEKQREGRSDTCKVARKMRIIREINAAA
jgi:hypothetical protein